MTYRARLVSTLLLSLTFICLITNTNCRMNPETNTNSSAPPIVPATADKSNDPRDIHRRAISIDMHADTTQRLVDERLDISRRLGDGHLDTERMKEGGLDAQFFSIWVEPQLYGGGGESAIRRADEQFAAVRALA